jgi:hypothetical protein
MWLGADEVDKCGPRSAHADAAESKTCMERSYIKMMATNGACVAFRTTILMALAFSDGSINRSGLSRSSGMRFSGGIK